MQLIVATNYAIRALVYFASAGRIVTASEVSEKMNVPKQYFVTLSRRLRDAGIISSVPGPAGGYLLARPAEEISLLDVVSVTESSTRINRCLEDDGECGLYDAECCPMRTVYGQLQEMIDNYFSGITLAMLVDRSRGAQSMRATG